ncbi:hypothetical protein GGF32_009691 [Allomyces javanicus]|nr:hypothetical protein GGF32_009691 [Allomyces javanicus]
MTFAPAPTTSVNVSQSQQQEQSIHASGSGNMTATQSQEQEQSVHVSGGHHTAPVNCDPAPPVTECHPAPPVDCTPAVTVECTPVVPVVECHPAPAPVECHPAPAPVECVPVSAPVECHPIVRVECHSSAVNDGTWIANHQVCFDDGLWFGGAMNFHAQDVSCGIQSIGASIHDQTADLFAQINCHPIAFSGPDCVTDVLAQHALQGQTQVQSIDLSGSACHNVDLSAIQVQTQSQHIDVNSAVCVHPITLC